MARRGRHDESGWVEEEDAVFTAVAMLSHGGRGVDDKTEGGQMARGIVIATEDNDGWDLPPLPAQLSCQEDTWCIDMNDGWQVWLTGEEGNKKGK